MPVWSFRETFSTPEQMRLVVGSVLEDAKTILLVEGEKWYDIKVILNELCCNALEHGEYPVELYTAICAGDNSLHILISDSGSGFVPELKQESDAAAERGRGLTLVSALADDLMFNLAANKVLVRMQL